jgi:hypothetical protein
MASNIASSAVNSISVRGLMNGGDFFNEKAFMEGSFGSNALAGVAAGMAGNAVTVGMNNWNLGKDAMKVDLFNSGQIGQMKALNSFVGGLTQSGITYGLTGNATFNVARVLGTGVMEMHVGKDGFGMNFGMSGTDISMGTIATAIQGAQHWRYNSRIESRADQLDLDIASALRSQYGFGDIMARKQLDSILDGTTDVKERKGETSEAESVTENGKKVVYLDNYREGMSREEQLRMGITLQHEAWRDGVVDENNKAETVMAVYAHTKMTERVEEDNRYSDMMKGIVAGDELLTADRKNMAEVDNDIVKFAGYVLEKYDSSGDYWRVTKDKDGNILKIEDDGSNDVTFVDEYGNQTGFEEYTGGSRTEFLGAHLGMSKDEANEMLKKAGYSLNSETGLFEGANAKKAFDITGNNELAVGSKEKGFLGGVKDAFNSVVDDAKNLYNSAKDKAGSLWSGLKSFLSREEKTESSAEYQALEKKFKEIEGLPYADDYKNQQKLDEKGLITKDSTAMNCIGLVSYLLNFRADYSVANFEKYSMFEKLSGISNFNDLQPGDVIRFRAGTNDNHVSIWAGNGKVLESVSSTRKPGVRIDDIWRMTNYYNKVYGKKYEVDYFRYSLSEVEQ